MDTEVTAQSLFDQVWDWFVVQGKPRSVAAGASHCAYRGAGGAKCAVGVLIRDDEYDPDMDDGAPTVTTMAECGLLPSRLVPHLDMLRQLQGVHDGAYQEATVANRLRAFADSNDFGVVAPSTAVEAVEGEVLP